MRKTTAPHDHIIVANRGWVSDPMTKSQATSYARLLKRTGNALVKVRRIG